MEIYAKYDRMCPNCGKTIISERLEKGFVCENCSKEILDEICKIKNIKNLKEFCDLKKEIKDFEEFCKEKGYDLLSIQKSWAKRVFKKHSFSIVAPTGIGKTTFGTFITSYLASKGKKCYIILPSSLLVKQVYERISNLLKYSKVNVVCYHSEMKNKEKKEVKEKIMNKKYDILITTSNFLSKNQIEDKFDLIFVDDVDSFLKASKNIERSLKLLGFDDETINLAYEIVFDIRKKNLEGIIEKREKLREKLKNYDHGVLIVSSATAKPRGDKIKLYRELLGFEIGFGRSKLRDVEDIYCENFCFETLLEMVKIFGPGGIIFAQKEEIVLEIEKILNDHGIKAKSVLSKNKKAFDDFLNGEIDILIGTASYYGVLVRGLDYPERVRYCVFYGIPKFKISASKFFDREFSSIEEVKSELEKRKIKNCVVLEENNEFYIMFPDVKTYIQGSGRTSRLTPFGLTKGASIVLVDNKELFDILKKYMIVMYDSEFKRFEDVDIYNLIKRIDEDREKLKKITESKKIPDILKSVLMVVESPNKARTISSFFGRPSVRTFGNKKVYEVCVGKYNLIITASGGHIFDLVTKKGYHGVEIKDHLYIPIYDTIKRINEKQFVDELENVEGYIDAIENINILRDIANEVDFVLIATDIDTEGEKIGYDIYLNLKPYNKNIFRIGFNEITKRAILKALEKIEGEIDKNKVKSQIVRRIEDRWIGFELSKKVQDHFGYKYLSAGRVQTPVLGWIIGRYNEFKKKYSYLTIELENGIVLSGFSDFVDLECAKIEVEIEEKEIKPKPPFTTESLIEDANRFLGFDSEKTMRIAQELFELALTTYHRTSSTRVSFDGQRIAKEYLEIEGMSDYFEPKEYYMEGPHECIRPTRPMDVSDLIVYLKENNIKLTKDHIKLYGLIFDKFIASQTKPCKLKVINIKELNTGLEKEGVCEIIFNGWTRFYHLDIPRLEPVESGEYKIINKTVKKIPKVTLFDDGSLVKMMKERGIGRPSTYYQIIKKLVDRHYVIRSKNKNKLVPTKLGISVYAYLMENYKEFVNEERTRELEEIMEKIENGEVDYMKVLDDIYHEILKIK